MSDSNIPDKYKIFNDENVKNISVVVEIPGIDLLSSTPIYTRIKYGDPDIFYGDPDLVYGGLRRVDDTRDILSLEGSSLTLSQRLEPEQGRASVSQISLSFIDKDQYMSKVIAPGVLIDDIMGKPVRIWLGYKNISYPQDYRIIFRGRITGYQYVSGRVSFQVSDPNIKSRAQIFFTAKTALSSDITNVSTNIPVVATDDFHQQILGPDGSYDTAVKTWIKIDDEYMEYGSSGITSPTQFTVTRSITDPFGNDQSPVSHDADADVTAVVSFHENPIILALKIMLSGWSGAFEEDVSILNFSYTSDPSDLYDDNAIILPTNKDAVRDYGLSTGDTVIVSGASNPGNNGTFVIQSFFNINDQSNNGIRVDTTFTAEIGTSATMDLRSQYDTLPVGCGCQLTGDYVDVERFKYIFNTFLASDEVLLVLEAQDSAKDFMERELYLPVAAYSLTRMGRLSVGYTTPPIADDRLKILDQDNIVDPKNIVEERSLTNNRKFFNEIDWFYDVNAAGVFVSTVKSVNADSISLIGQTSILPIQTKGSRSTLGFSGVVNQRSIFLLNRYSLAGVIISLQTFYGVGNLIEPGDVVLLKDDGNLKIANLFTGKRNNGSQLYEVIDRTFDIKNGKTTLKLLSGVGVTTQDKFATYAPSSNLTTASTASAIHITDSFSAATPKFPHEEFRKWEDYTGLKVRIHNLDYSLDEETTFTSFNSANKYIMNLSPALSFTPNSGSFQVDLAAYSTSTDPLDQQIVKLIHDFYTPSVDVVTGISSTQFTVGAGDASKFQVGQPVYIHNADYSPLFLSEALSNEGFVVDITGTTITVSSSLGYTPSAGQIVELIGFPDGGPPYRYL